MKGLRRASVIALVLLLFSVAAYADVHIVMLNTKGEIQAQLEDTAKAFSAENAGTTLEIQPCPAGNSPFQAMSALYAAGNAPALAMLDPTDIPLFAGTFTDLKNEKWTKDCTDDLNAQKTASGDLLSFPLCFEGYGMIYNKAVLDKAGVDPTKIHTTRDLEAAYKKVQATGVGAVIVGPMDWSLAAHFLGVAYSDAGKNQAGFLKIIADLKAGNADLSKNKVFTGLLDTFDVNIKYNLRKDDALATTYDDCAAAIGSGKVGFYFQGNWTWPQMSAFTSDLNGFGFIPVPISNNAGDYGNSGIPVSASKRIGIDKQQNSAAQQAAAKSFLNWLVYTPTGQDALVNKCNLIPAFKNITLQPKDPLAKSILQYAAKGQTLLAVAFPPPDHWSKVGAMMQKYLGGKIDRAELFKEIHDYWKNVQ